MIVEIGKLAFYAEWTRLLIMPVEIVSTLLTWIPAGVLQEPRADNMAVRSDCLC